MNFRRSVIIAELWRLISQDVGKNYHFAFFWKNDPLPENIQNSIPKAFIASPIDVLCSNFSKFGRREIGKIGYLRKKNFASLSSSRYCGDRTQNLPESAPDNILSVLDFIQIGSLSAELYSNA